MMAPKRQKATTTTTTTTTPVANDDSSSNSPIINTKSRKQVSKKTPTPTPTTTMATAGRKRKIISSSDDEDSGEKEKNNNKNVDTPTTTSPDDGVEEDERPLMDRASKSKRTPTRAQSIVAQTLKELHKSKEAKARPTVEQSVAPARSILKKTSELMPPSKKQVPATSHHEDIIDSVASLMDDSRTKPKHADHHQPSTPQRSMGQGPFGGQKKYSVDEYQQKRTLMIDGAPAAPWPTPESHPPRMQTASVQRETASRAADSAIINTMNRYKAERDGLHKEVGDLTQRVDMAMNKLEKASELIQEARSALAKPSATLAPPTAEFKQPAPPPIVTPAPGATSSASKQSRWAPSGDGSVGSGSETRWSSEQQQRAQTPLQGKLDGFRVPRTTNPIPATPSTIASRSSSVSRPQQYGYQADDRSVTPAPSSTPMTRPTTDREQQQQRSAFYQQLQPSQPNRSASPAPSMASTRTSSVSGFSGGDEEQQRPNPYSYQQNDYYNQRPQSESGFRDGAFNGDGGYRGRHQFGGGDRGYRGAGQRGGAPRGASGFRGSRGGNQRGGGSYGDNRGRGGMFNSNNNNYNDRRDSWAQAGESKRPRVSYTDLDAAGDEDNGSNYY